MSTLINRRSPAYVRCLPTKQLDRYAWKQLDYELVLSLCALPVSSVNIDLRACCKHAARDHYHIININY